MIYLLDSNTLIEAKNRHYRMKTLPSIWSELENKTQVNILEDVITELEEQSDDLTVWAQEFRKAHPNRVHRSADQVTQHELRAVVAWANQNYSPGAKLDEFLNKADPILIAKAIAIHKQPNDIKIVTAEKSSLSPRKPKIPDACRHFDIHCINIFEMFEELGTII